MGAVNDLSNETALTLVKDRSKDRTLTAEVVGIHWERIFLFLDIQVHDQEGRSKHAPLEFYAVDRLLYLPLARFKVLGQDGDVYHLKLNVTNSGDNHCLPAAQYYLAVCQGEDYLAECEAGISIVSNMDAYSRNFFYRNMHCVYAVNFYVEEGDIRLPFRFCVLAAAKTNKGMVFPSNSHLHSRIHPFKDLKETWLSRRNFVRRLYRLYTKIYAKNRKNTILFMSEQSGVIASNLKAVSDRMKERGLDKEYRLLYSAREASDNGRGAKSWFDMLQKVAKSSLIFLDDHAPVFDWLPLTEDTRLIQLWHAGAGFKSSGYSRWGHEGCPAPESCHRQYDFGIAGSKQIAPFFSEVWGINDEQVLPLGMPRMDEYLDPAYQERKKKELYQKYPLCEGKKVILFAPTYRGRSKVDAFYPYELIDFDALYELCGDEYVVFFKMHPWVSGKVPIKKKHKDRFVDVGSYPNINDLFYITELLITDYSSNIFEYSLMRKPMLFFAFDKIQYAFSRGFHRPYEESAPGKVCYTFEELLDAIRNQDFAYEKVEEYVKKHFDYIDCHASDRVIDWIVLGQLPEEIQEGLRRVDEDNKRMRRLQFVPLPGDVEALGNGEEDE